MLEKGDKVLVQFHMTITEIVNNKEHPDRSFVCGDVELGDHETKPDLKKMAYVSGIPISTAVPLV